MSWIGHSEDWDFETDEMAYEKRKLIGVRLFYDHESSRRDTHRERTHTKKALVNESVQAFPS